MIVWIIIKINQLNMCDKVPIQQHIALIYIVRICVGYATL
jgi:hypothetical protein